MEVAAYHTQNISAAMNASGKVSEINSKKMRTCLSSEINLIVICMHVCMCLSHTHMQVYVWGNIPQLQNDDKTPIETNLQSLDEVFSVYGDGTMYRALKIGICTIHLHSCIIFD